MELPTALHLRIVSADRSLVDETVDEVEIPGDAGYFGVLPGHTPLLASLGAGELWYRQKQEYHYVSIAFGFAEVQPDSVTILAQTAEKAQEIDIARAEAAKRRAEERLHSPVIDKIDVVRTAKVRREKLYFLRGLKGKAARMKDAGKKQVS